MYDKLNEDWQYYNFDELTLRKLAINCNLIVKAIENKQIDWSIDEALSAIITALNYNTKHAIAEAKERNKQAKFERKHRRLIKAINKKRGE